MPMIAALVAVLLASPVSQLSDADLSARLAQVHALPFPERIDRLTGMFLGTPYGELPLGDGSGPENWGRWRTDKVDCQTFVETVLAMANARSLPEAKAILDDIRYNGAPSFENRNHFTEAQWLPVNLGKGYFTDETPAIDGRAPTETLTLVHAKWSQVPVLRRLANINNIPDGKYNVRYLPLDELRARVKSIVPGSIIMVVREYDPNRVVRISHMGFVVKTDKGWMVRHASTGPEHAVIEVPLGEYVEKMSSFKKWKVVGFALAQPVDGPARLADRQDRAKLKARSHREGLFLAELRFPGGLFLFGGAGGALGVGGQRGPAVLEDLHRMGKVALRHEDVKAVHGRGDGAHRPAARRL